MRPEVRTREQGPYLQGNSPVETKGGVCPSRLNFGESVFSKGIFPVEK